MNDLYEVALCNKYNWTFTEFEKQSQKKIEKLLIFLNIEQEYGSKE